MTDLPIKAAVLLLALSPANFCLWRSGSRREAGGLPYLALIPANFCLWKSFAREPQHSSVGVTIHSGHPGCIVELDAASVGKTDAQGDLVLESVEATDHYFHVRCPNQPEQAYFVSPRAGESVEIRPKSDAGPPALSALDAAEGRIELRRLVQKAVQLRAAGQFEEAVRDLHEAASLDPENSDLHRELGITFLLEKDWKRARVEMLEAIKHDPTDADAHNGLGYALDKMGETAAALAEYRAAARLDPEDPSYRQHYLEQLGKLAAEQAAKKK